LLGILIASSLFAVPPEPTNTAVTLGSPDYTFEVDFTGLALQAFANNLDYAAEASPFNYGFMQPILSPDWAIVEIDPRFHFGFDLGAAWFFHRANSNLMLNWERFHPSKDSDSFIVSITEDMIGPFFEIGPDASVYKKAEGSVKFSFDEINLDYGTLVHFGDLLRLNLFAGVSGLRLKEHRSTTFSDLDGTTIRRLDVPTRFLGAGPQLGGDFTYKIVRGFDFAGSFRGTLFVGSFHNKTDYSTQSNALATLGDPDPNFQSTHVDRKKGVVPAIEGRLGLAYEFLFGCHYMFKLEAGYQAQIYVNAIRSIDMGSEVALNDIGSEGSMDTGVYARTFQRTVSDFGLAGPYATLYFAF
jgi:hypothetical protein